MRTVGQIDGQPFQLLSLDEDKEQDETNEGRDEEEESTEETFARSDTVDRSGGRSSFTSGCISAVRICPSFPFLLTFVTFFSIAK